MRARKTKLEKFGYVCKELTRDIKNHNIETAFAFNSKYNKKVFNFNCDWFKCINPFDNVEIKDIRGFAHHFLINSEFKDFCDTHNKYTESGNYSTTAETLTQYIRNDIDFTEDHTALSDSIIEWEILKECITKGADLTENYKAKKSIHKPKTQTLTIKYNDEKVFTINCESYLVKKSKNTIYCKGE